MMLLLSVKLYCYMTHFCDHFEAVRYVFPLLFYEIIAFEILND